MTPLPLPPPTIMPLDRFLGGVASPRLDCASSAPLRLSEALGNRELAGQVPPREGAGSAPVEAEPLGQCVGLLLHSPPENCLTPPVVDISWRHVVQALVVPPVVVEVDEVFAVSGNGTVG